jgi:energy-coupling factor transport system ATP-binding protein
MITLQNVFFKYANAKKNLFDNLSVTINKGEFVGIIGPTGSGKSSFCYLLNGLIPHAFHGSYEGSVIIDDIIIANSSVNEMSQIIGLMMQEPSFQIASPLVESEIAFGMENLKIPREEMEERISTISQQLNIEPLLQRATGGLSEGEKQRVLFASILAMQPEILVLDEVSSMIDLVSKQSLKKTLQQIHQEQEKIILMVDHDLDLLLPLVDRILLFNEGEIVADGSTEKILTDYELLENNGLIAPTLVRLFQQLQEENHPIGSSIPSSYSEAKKIIGGWL